MHDFDEKLRLWQQSRLSVKSWDFFRDASDEEKISQGIYQDVLRQYAGARFFGACYVSEFAKIYTDSLEINQWSTIAEGAILRHNIILGSNCFIGSYCHLAGSVKIGSDTMVSGHCSIYGFNHGTSPSTSMISQACEGSGIIIGDDCWIGANAVIVDGVEIGDHSIVAAGAVVTKSVPAWSVVGGVPAKVLRSRIA